MRGERRRVSAAYVPVWVLRKAERARKAASSKAAAPVKVEAPLEVTPPREAATLPPQTPPSLKAAAQAHAPDMLESLVELAKGAKSEAVRVSAANAVLDRAHGKPASGGKSMPDDEAGEGTILEVRWLDSRKQ